MPDATVLRDVLGQIDGRGYGAWRRLGDTWSVGELTVEVSTVQSDPYAPPTRLEVEVPAGYLDLPAALRGGATRRRALGDHLLRVLVARLPDLLDADAGRQQVLERTAVTLHRDGNLDLRVTIELPDRSRTVRADPVAAALLEDLPAAVDRLRWDRLDRDAARSFVATVEDAVALRRSLDELGLVAFVADGSRLPRRSGADDRPADDDRVVPVRSPDRLRVEVELPNRGPVEGLGIPAGVTVIAGGGFHGKSTLLDALRMGVYDHVPGDGRELVVTRDDAVTIRAEDGRHVARVDISPFVGEVPAGVGMGGDGPPSTASFSSGDASGSTSQAAATVEALEAGAGVLLIDEDTAATNLMVRDRRMQELLGDRDDGGRGYATEPITPFVDLVRSLWEGHGVSTVLVIGGTGDYLGVADHVIQMEAFVPRDVTARAHELAQRLPGRTPEPAVLPPVPGRVVDPESVDVRRRGRIRTRVFGTHRMQLGGEEVDLAALEQLVEPSQVQGVASAIVRLAENGYLDGAATLRQALDALFAEVDAGGLEVLRGGYPGDLARPRPLEVAAALNRLRSLRVAGPA